MPMGIDDWALCAVDDRMTTEAPEKIITPLWFQEETLDAVDDLIRYIIMIGGTGAGKTFWEPVWLAYVIARDLANGNGDGARYIALGCTGDMVNDMILPMIQEHYTGTYLEGHYHISGRRYELPTGGNIYLRSAEKPYRIEGHHVRGMIVDEPSEMKALIWPIIMRRTAFHNAPVLFGGYPTNMGWYYESLYVPWTKGDPAIKVIEFASTDNPMYPKEEMERAKRTLPTWLYEMTYLGKFRKPFGLVYPDFGDSCYVEPREIPDDWPTYVAVDPAVQYGALMVAWHQGIYYVYNEYYEEQVLSAREYADALLALQGGALPDEDGSIEPRDDPCGGINQGWIYDPARLTDVVNLADCGCGPFYRADNAVRPGIVTLTGLIKSGRFKVMRGRAPMLCDMMAKYRWPTDPATGKIIKVENPIKKHDHLPDCARYIVHTLEGAPLEERGVAVYNASEDISPY